MDIAFRCPGNYPGTTLSNNNIIPNHFTSRYKNANLNYQRNIPFSSLFPLSLLNINEILHI